jgi:NADPH2:quinone reductase
VGAAVDALAIGQRVVAMGETNVPGFSAGRAVVPATRVIAVPDGVDLRYATALPTSWLSAWYCLRRLADVQAGETVLIHAAASGVGSAAVRIAVDVGATVIATANSPKKSYWVRNLGAHRVLDSSVLHGDAWVDGVKDLTDRKGVDAVLDIVGGPVFADSLRVIGYGGRVVAMASVALAPSAVDTRDFYPKNGRIFGFQITALMEHGYDPRPDLGELLAGVAAQRFTVDIDAVFPLANAADAHRHIELRANRGKVLLTM